MNEQEGGSAPNVPLSINFPKIKSNWHHCRYLQQFQACLKQWIHFLKYIPSGSPGPTWGGRGGEGGLVVDRGCVFVFWSIVIQKEALLLNYNEPLDLERRLLNCTMSTWGHVFCSLPCIVVPIKEMKNRVDGDQCRNRQSSEKQKLGAIVF